MSKNAGVRTHMARSSSQRHGSQMGGSVSHSARRLSSTAHLSHGRHSTIGGASTIIIVSSFLTSLSLCSRVVCPQFVCLSGSECVHMGFYLHEDRCIAHTMAILVGLRGESRQITPTLASRRYSKSKHWFSVVPMPQREKGKGVELLSRTIQSLNITATWWYLEVCSADFACEVRDWPSPELSKYCLRRGTGTAIAARSDYTPSTPRLSNLRVKDHPPKVVSGHGSGVR
jgi:hypothetical protein